MTNLVCSILLLVFFGIPICMLMFGFVFDDLLTERRLQSRMKLKHELEMKKLRSADPDYIKELAKLL